MRLSLFKGHVFKDRSDGSRFISSNGFTGIRASSIQPRDHFICSLAHSNESPGHRPVGSGSQALCALAGSGGPPSRSRLTGPPGEISLK